MKHVSGKVFFGGSGALGRSTETSGVARRNGGGERSAVRSEIRLEIIGEAQKNVYGHVRTARKDASVEARAL